MFALRAVVGLVLVGMLVGCANDAQGPAVMESEATADPHDAAFETPSPAVLAPEAVNADQHFADTVVVADDRLTLPTAGNEAVIAKLKTGSILAGNRSSIAPAIEEESAPNPLGFLRRVVSVTTEGAQTVIVTEHAELADWLDDGDIDFSSSQSLLDGTTATAPTVKTQTLQLQSDDEGAGGGGANANISASMGGTGFSVSLSKASLRLNAKLDGYFKVHHKHIPFVPDPPTGVKFRSHLTLDPVISAQIAVAISRSVPLTEKEWTTRRPITIPVGGPIPLSVQFSPALKCGVSASGTVDATVNAQVGAHAELGFEGKAGLTDFPDVKNLSRLPTFSASIKLVSTHGKESLAVECQLLAVPAVFAFDAVGMKGKIGPYISLNADACSGKIAIYEEHGLAGEFAGRVQIPFLHRGKDFKLLGLKTALGKPLYLLGNDDTCGGASATVKDVDSCAGRRDGFYCSEVHTFSGYVCKGGQIDHGMQCDTDQRCTGGSDDDIQCR